MTRRGTDRRHKRWDIVARTENFIFKAAHIIAKPTARRWWPLDVQGRNTVAEDKCSRFSALHISEVIVYWYTKMRVLQEMVAIIIRSVFVVDYCDWIASHFKWIQEEVEEGRSKRSRRSDHQGRHHLVPAFLPVQSLMSRVPSSRQQKRPHLSLLRIRLWRLTSKSFI